MKLSLRQKQTFYHELGQFLRTGIPLPQAVEALVPETPRGSMRNALERLAGLFRQGETVSGAFAKMVPMIGAMEVTLTDAASTSGRLDQAFVYLAAYFESLAGVRSGIIKQVAWPLVQLHLGVLVVNLPGIFAGGTFTAYLTRCAGDLIVFYIVAVALWVGVAAVLRWGRGFAGADRVLRRIPVLGALRRNLSLSRFCAVYEMQLQAAINIMDGLRSAAAASQSALLQAEVERIIPELRNGGQVGVLLTGSPAIPAALQRVLRIGEDTGTLDEDLRKWSEYYRNAALANLQTIGNWLPRVVFLFLAIYIGYVVVTVFKDIMVSPLEQMLKEN